MENRILFNFYLHQKQIWFIKEHSPSLLNTEIDIDIFSYISRKIETGCTFSRTSGKSISTYAITL